MAQYAILVPLLPLASFFIIVLFTNRNKRLSSTVAIGSMILAGILSYLIFFDALRAGSHHVLEAAASGERPWTTTWEWAAMGLTTFQIGTYVDPLAAITIVMVTTVGLMIFIYSQGYMAADPLYSRFFAYLSLFASGMLGFVLAPNLVQALVFWEIMGLCSFLLIGFWFNKTEPILKVGNRFKADVQTTQGVDNSNAAKKAFLTTRVGDVGFFLGIVALWGAVGNIQFYELFQEPVLNRLREAHFVLGGEAGFVLPALTLIPLLLFMGAVGKSAQFPLHVWLPDAMAGPTPVSAMIHAATMVAAGVFLVARMYPVFAAAGEGGHGSLPLSVVAAVGAFTALFAATIGVAQRDIKRILAYSTVSQLGYMIMALGIGAWVAGVFHMLTHAFFKALLFLGSGSVIHGMEHLHHSHSAHGEDAQERHSHDAHDAHGAHDGHSPAHNLVVNNPDSPDPDDPQDIFNMGGLRSKMPITFWTYMMGTLALTGIPIWAGFWSKDEILADAFGHGQYVFWAVGTLAAFFTAFYMARQVFLVFFGRPRTRMAEAAVESPPSMTFPLAVLAVFATFVGLLGMPDNIGPLHTGAWFHHWVGLVPTTGLGAEAVEAAERPTSLNFLVAGVSVAVALLGWALGYLLYGRQPFKAGQRDPLSRQVVWPVLYNKYYVDELYSASIIKASVWTSGLLALVDQRIVDGLVNLVARIVEVFSRIHRWVDTYLVDGAVNGVAWINDQFGRGLRLIQTGLVQNYLLVVFLSVLLLSGIYLVFR